MRYGENKIGVTMKKTYLLAAAVTALASLSSMAQADDEKGIYIRGNVGYGVIPSVDYETVLAGDGEGKGDIAGSVGIGYNLGNNWRVELDGFQIFNNMGAIDQNASSYAKLRNTMGMLNVLYDFDGMGRWEPYIGGGIGYNQTTLKASAHDYPNYAGTFVPFSNPACTAHNDCFFDDKDSGFAWQLIGGLGYDLTDNLSWDTQYRYTNVGSRNFDGTGKDVNGPLFYATLTPTYGADNLIQTKVDSIDSHTLLTGLSYRFGHHKMKPEPIMYTCWNGDSVESLSTCPPEPVEPTYISCWDGSQVEQGVGTCPPTPQIVCWDNSTVTDPSQCPAEPDNIQCWDGTLVNDARACPPQTYQQQLCANEYRVDNIYYDFNKDQSPETREKIQRILDTDTYCAVSNIHVIGHTDTMGPAEYNQGLSERRAKDVRAELIRQGIDTTEITTEGKGETDLLIQTGDQKAERQNRRTEVQIRLHSVGVVNN